MSEKPKRGRPSGRKTTYTHPDKDVETNLQSAFWGPDDGNRGTTFMHQLWINRNPSDYSLKERAKGMKITPAQVLAEVRADREISPPFVDWILEAVDSGDWRFFECAARTLKKCHESPKGRLSAEDPIAKSILLFVEETRRRSPNAVFTAASILDGADWEGRGCPDEKTVRSAAARLGVKLQTAKRGRPKKT